MEMRELGVGVKRKEEGAWRRGRELGVGVKRKEEGAGCRGEEERGRSLV